MDETRTFCLQLALTHYHGHEPMKIIDMAKKFETYVTHADAAPVPDDVKSGDQA